MRLTVFNGSPRVRRSNTGLLLEHLLAGFASNGGEVVGVHYLAQPARRAAQVAAFAEADAVLIAFPLYADAMPATVKAFVEALVPLIGGCGGMRIMFLVQSGFPEACHSRPLEAWLEKFARRLGATYLGTIVKGGVEGIRDRPPFVQRTLFASFRTLGERLAEVEQLDPALLTTIAGQDRYSRVAMALFVPLMLRFVSSWWNRQMRENGVFADRFAAPYGEPSRARSWRTSS
jgi:NAD(P)H-dependent FMN reductase